jgi:hypothetical protein
VQAQFFHKPHFTQFAARSICSLNLKNLARIAIEFRREANLDGAS